MGNVSELPGDLDCHFSLVRAEKVDGMVGVGGSELGWLPPAALGASAKCSDLILLMVEMLQ